MEDLKCINGEYGDVFMCIDLKSFYASVECVERGLDPMTTDLVVADPTRSDKTICLAVSPSLRARGVSSRARVFEIPKSFTYIMAPPRMVTTAVTTRSQGFPLLLASSLKWINPIPISNVQMTF